MILLRLAACARRWAGAAAWNCRGSTTGGISSTRCKTTRSMLICSACWGLARAGNLIASWLSARSRLTSFAVLRALGASSKQLASILTWEQSIIYLTSLLLGLLFGAILSLLALPALVFTNAGSSGTQSNVTSSSFFVAQTVPPVQIVIPPALLLVLAILIVICVAALTLMVRVVSRPSISQTLRLNED